MAFFGQILDNDGIWCNHQTAARSQRTVKAARHARSARKIQIQLILWFYLPSTHLRLFRDCPAVRCVCFLVSHRDEFLYLHPNQHLLNAVHQAQNTLGETAHDDPPDNVSRPLWPRKNPRRWWAQSYAARRPTIAALLRRCTHPAAAAAGSCGIPDLGITTLEDVLIDVRRITDVTELPLLVDIDTGWGGAFNIARAIRHLEKAGAAAALSKTRCSKSAAATAEQGHRAAG